VEAGHRPLGGVGGTALKNFDGVLGSFVLVFAMCAGGGLGAASADDAGSRPHIVYIVSDDQGWKDVGYHGSDIRTPTLDALAAGGARLEQFYTQNMCTQTRAAMLTGRYPFRYGLQTAVIPTASRYGLATDEVLLPQCLKDAGYATAISGKWHVGHGERKLYPGARGFDRAYGALVGELDYFTHEAHGVLDWYRQGEPVREEGYATTLFGDEAVRVIEGHDPKSPLYLYLAFNAPHAPYQAPKEHVDRYASIPDESRRTYAAMISALDEQVGRVVAALEKKGMRGNTLIVYHSDNGGPRSAKFTGEVDTSKATIPCDNGPWRDGKATMYEGGHRVVALASWPGHIKAGLVVDQPMHVVDMLPTLCALAGASTSKCKPLDGIDVWGTIAEGKPSPRNEIVYNIEPFRAALRLGEWKLVWKATLPSLVELFDLKDDPSETTNVADKHPARVAELKARIEQLSKEATTPLLLGDVAASAKKALMGPLVTSAEDAAVARDP
jgi:arylsulfatase A-like enzyme